MAQRLEDLGYADGAVYSSTFSPSSHALRVLTDGKILAPAELPNEMVERVVWDLCLAEEQLGTGEDERLEFASAIGTLMDSKRIVFSTPIMTNAAREEHRPLSACTVPPVDLRGDLSRVRDIVDTYHQEALGTGFDLSEVDDPVATLVYLNAVAVAGANSGREDRPVGNMATCRASHPRIIEFITAKRDRPGDWKFNISVDAPEAFWAAVVRDVDWTLDDGTKVRARTMFDLIAESAHACADPGIISLERLNADNPVPGLGRYTSTAPCAEVGLMPGETCQFGYINLGGFVDRSTGLINFDALAETAQLMTRALDDALELSIGRYNVQTSAEIMAAKRKIGVGVCGLADMLAELGVPYDSAEGRDICRDVVAFINYQTKLASLALARDRGSFGAMSLVSGCRYSDGPGFLETKYGGLETASVTSTQWRDLGKLVRGTRLLRNCSTVALPPTGRSGLVISASTGVEPLFTLIVDGQVHPAMARALERHGLNTSPNLARILETGSCQDLDIPAEVKRVFRTATEIAPEDHVMMVAAIQPYVDESVSKTINLPSTATVGEVKAIYMLAHQNGLKGITVYRNGSSQHQPRTVTQLQ